MFSVTEKIVSADDFMTSDYEGHFQQEADEVMSE